MEQIDQMNEAEIAWVLLEQIENTKNLLLQIYHHQFMIIEQRKELQKIEKDNLPF